MMQQHRLKALAEQAMGYNKQLQEQYADTDNLLREELARMKEGALGTFDMAVRDALDYYEQHPAAEAVETELPSPMVAVEFSGEEVWGKYLDLHPLFATFSNLIKKHDIEQDYQQYLERFSSFFYVPPELKLTSPYLGYLKDLWGYLLSFYRRTHPMIDMDSVLGDWQAEFKQKLQAGELKLPSGVSSASHTHTLTQPNSHTQELIHTPQPLRLGMFTHPGELEALGMDRLKEGLEALGLKCGGTLKERAERLWQVRKAHTQHIFTYITIHMYIHTYIHTYTFTNT
ncbi:hypothetical protein EON64_11860 [archaeon]|nr:MAG: hypothetical protein EON64_11860 [archaeon]